MTIKELLAKLGINLDANVDSSIPEQQEQQQEQQEQQQEQQAPPPSQDAQRIADLEKEIKELKEANARMLAQTPVEHQQTADEALLELLGIGGNDNGNESDG